MDSFANCWNCRPTLVTRELHSAVFTLPILHDFIMVAPLSVAILLLFDFTIAQVISGLV